MKDFELKLLEALEAAMQRRQGELDGVGAADRNEYAKREGILIFVRDSVETTSGRYHAYFGDLKDGLPDLEKNSKPEMAALHCGTRMEVYINGHWVPTRMEMRGADTWYLVGLPIGGHGSLKGFRVRL